MAIHLSLAPPPPAPPMQIPVPPTHGLAHPKSPIRSALVAMERSLITPEPILMFPLVSTKIVFRTSLGAGAAFGLVAFVEATPAAAEVINEQSRTSCSVMLLP